MCEQPVRRDKLVVGVFCFRGAHFASAMCGPVGDAVVQTNSHLTRREFLRFLSLMRSPHFRDVLPRVNLNHYLNTVAIAYSALFSDPEWLKSIGRYSRSRFSASPSVDANLLWTRSPLEQYQMLSDGRHGGLLDLPPDDCSEFEAWYHSHDRFGSHPFEIVAGDRNFGVMLRVDWQRDGRNGWEYELSVHSLGLSVLAARMAISLNRARVPFEFRDPESTLGHIVLNCSRV